MYVSHEPNVNWLSIVYMYNELGYTTLKYLAL